MKVGRVLASAAFFSVLTGCSSVMAAEVLESSENQEVAAEDDSVGVESSFDGVFFGLGGGWNNAKYKLKLKAWGGEVSRSSTVNLLNGIFWLGYGKAFGSFYLGLVASANFGKSKDVKWIYDTTELGKFMGSKFDINEFNNSLREVFAQAGIGEPKAVLTVKAEGFSPAAALRLGWIRGGVMVYGDLGFSYRHVKAKCGIEAKLNGALTYRDLTGWIHVHGVSPLVRVGVQKIIYNNVAVSLGGEYRCKVKCEDGGSRVEGNEGWGVYLSAVYNVKF